MKCIIILGSDESVLLNESGTAKITKLEEDIKTTLFNNGAKRIEIIIR